jgi:hypothetical protein
MTSNDTATVLTTGLTGRLSPRSAAVYLNGSAFSHGFEAERRDLKAFTTGVELIVKQTLYKVDDMRRLT